MVNSIKYWADVSGLVPLQNQENNKINYETKLGEILKIMMLLELNESTWLLHYFIQNDLMT